MFFQKVPVKVSPEKPSDWFCNSFDSRAGRKRKSSHANPRERGDQQEADTKRVDDLNMFIIWATS